jgi:hypothetical protein
MMMPNDDRSVPVTTPDEGCELCYECRGDRLCWGCAGTGQMLSGERCYQCAGTGLCIVCSGDGQLPAGTKDSPQR